MRSLFFVLALASCGGTRSSPEARPPAEPRKPAANELLAVADFNVIVDRAARSRALFSEAARVMLHPRCTNCHPSGDIPHQRFAMELHEPPVVRGPADQGVPGMECTTCHQDRNQQLTRIPGAPKWQLAPLEMAWTGKSAGYICNQIKDPQRNGGKTRRAQLA